MNRIHAMQTNAAAAMTVAVLACSAGMLFPGCHRPGGSKQSQADNYVRNGDFEKVDNGASPYWDVSGKVKPEQVSGKWQTLTGTFNSGDHTSGKFLFFVKKGAIGSVWIDNIALSPAAPIKNASFEELRPDGRPTECDISYWNEAAFSDTNRASHGSRSLRMTHEHEAVPETQLRQKFAMAPDTEYTYAFDVFVGDDFQGEALACVEALSSRYEEVSILVEIRDRCGRTVLALTPSEHAPATVSQGIGVQPGMNLHASVDINNKAFRGSTKLVVEDPTSGRVLGEAGQNGVSAKWQSIQVSFQSVSPELRVRVIAEGEGSLQVDNVAVTPPEVIPPLQDVQWLPATENFSIPARWEVSVQGRAGKAIEGGLELLRNDLKPYGVALARTEPAETPLRVIIASTAAVRGKGTESYSLTVNRKGVTIRAGAEPGAFYGLMTLLQLMGRRDGKPVVLACEATDYPDMPLRGVLYGDREQAARWKMNTFMESSGYPTSAAQKKAFSDSIQKCEKLNQQYIPYALAMMGGQYVQRINPNLAAGIWTQDESIALKGVEPSPLANHHVIRTKLTDVKLKSPDGAREYKMGVDYQVIDGDMRWNHGWNGKPIPGYTARPFSVARLTGSAIPDGATVLASYDWVSHHRASDNRTETHIAYVPLEPETRRLMDEFLRELVRDFPLSYTCYGNCLHEFGPNDAQLATDSRVINSGKEPIQLFAEDISSMAVAVKRGNPEAKAIFWSGSMNNHYVRAAEPFISRDAHAQVWGYSDNWPAVYGREAIEYWSELGFETSVMAWDNLRNIRGWAQVVAEARRKGYPCLGMIEACWGGRTGGLQEAARVSWKTPKAGEKGYVPLPKTGDVGAKREKDPAR